MRTIIKSLIITALVSAVLLPSADAQAIEGDLQLQLTKGTKNLGMHRYACQRPNNTAATWGCRILNEKLDARKGRPQFPWRLYQVECRGGRVIEGYTTLPKFSAEYLYRESDKAASCKDLSPSQNHGRYSCRNLAPTKDFVYNIDISCTY